MKFHQGQIYRCEIESRKECLDFSELLGIVPLQVRNPTVAKCTTTISTILEVNSFVHILTPSGGQDEASQCKVNASKLTVIYLSMHLTSHPYIMTILSGSLYSVMAKALPLGKVSRLLQIVPCIWSRD